MSRESILYWRIPAYLIIISNLAFHLIASVQIIATGGGPWGWGLLLLPITMIAHIFLLVAIRSLIHKEPSLSLRIWTVLGALWCLAWMAFLGPSFYTS